MKKQLEIEGVKLVADAMDLLRKGMREDQIAVFRKLAVDYPVEMELLQEASFENLANKRDQIIFGEEYKQEKYSGGLRYFRQLRRHEFRELIEERIYDPYLWTGYLEYVWFMEKYGNDDKLYLHGFVYSPERTEYSNRQGGIAIEGIGRDSKWEHGAEAEKIFVRLFGKADQFDLDPPYVWYD